MAYRCGTPVRRLPSTMTNPLSSFTPGICSRPMFSVTGRRPMATRIQSLSTSVALPPSLGAMRCLIPVFVRSSDVGSTVEPGRTVIPRLVKRRVSSLLMSGSSSGTMRSMNSTSRTSAPRSPYRLAHSTPMAPAPMIVTDFGGGSRRRASSESMIRSWSTLRSGRWRGALPVARMRSVALASRSPDSPPLTLTLVGPVRTPLPRSTVTAFFFMRNSTPRTCLSTTASRRLPRLAGSRPMPSALVSPNSPPSSLTRCKRSAVSSSALDGMQPRFRQVPPSLSRSTMATFMPSWAARMAPT